jgi:hypothetical protein
MDAPFRSCPDSGFLSVAGEKLSVRLLPLALGGKGRNGSSESAIIILSPVAMDEMFELFDNKLLITDNTFHHVANRNYTD